MALVSFIRRLTLFYSKYTSSLYSVVLGSYIHELDVYPCYVDVLGLYTRMLVVYPCYHNIGLYTPMHALRPCFSTYSVGTYTLYSLVDLYYGIGSMAMLTVASVIVTIARDGRSVVNNASMMLGLLSFIEYEFAPRVANVGRMW